MNLFVVEFLTRPGCHLCDDARPLVVAEVGRARGGLREVDIESDELLLGSYGLRIPVLLGPGGEVLAEGVIDRKSLRKALRRLGV